MKLEPGFRVKLFVTTDPLEFMILSAMLLVPMLVMYFCCPLEAEDTSVAAGIMGEYLATYADCVVTAVGKVMDDGIPSSL
jgi:hypothetical protein